MRLLKICVGFNKKVYKNPQVNCPMRGRKSIKLEECEKCKNFKRKFDDYIYCSYRKDTEKDPISILTEIDKMQNQIYKITRNISYIQSDVIKMMKDGEKK